MGFFYWTVGGELCVTMPPDKVRDLAYALEHEIM